MSSSHMIGYSKSSRAKCHGPKPCKGSPLEAGSLRYGKITFDNVTKLETVEWRHWGCVTPDILKALASATDITGLDELSTADRQKVRTAIATRHVDAADIPLTARRATILPSQNITQSSQKKRKASATPASSVTPASALGPLVNSQIVAAKEMGEDNTVEEVGDELIVSMRTQVVGIQYYKGLVGPGEEVIVVREPRNKYDQNAVRVDNIGHTQVGHLPRAVSRKLAPLMDSRSITVEGVIPDGNLSGHRGYTLDITLKMYGSSDRVPELQPQLIWATPGQRGFKNTTDRQTSRQLGRIPPLAQQSSSRQTPAQSESARKQQEAIQKAAELREMLKTLEKVNDEGRRSSLLDSLCSTGDILSLPLHPNPPGIDSGELKVNLLKHQIQGLQWCIEREYPELPKKETDKPIQFWQLRRNGNKSYYYNLATKTPQESAPHLGRGALFGDAMGMGKTLTILSLILATKTDTPTAFSNATLVVVPLSVLSNWEKQIQDHCTDDSLKFCSYYGNNRSQFDADELAKYDVVFTTYQMVAGEHDADNTNDQSKKKRRKIGRALFDVKWKRIVLDEGHCIRNPKTKIAKAVCALDAQRRWVLTGTPIINSPRDLGSLLTFLQICRPLDNEDFFKRLLLRPLQSGSPSGVELLRALMSHACLRRTKEMQDDNGNALVPLPPIEMIIVPVALSDEAKALYDEVERLSSQRFQSLISGGSSAVVQSNALSMLTRMRQLALHPALIPPDYLEQLRAVNGLEDIAKSITVTAELKQRLQARMAQAIEECEECPICFTIPSEPKITSCAHVFCSPCITEVILHDPKCPMDRRPLTMNDLYDPLPPDMTQPAVRPESMEIEEGIRKAPSAKIEQLVHMLQLTPTGEKSLVFSQFTSFLDKIADALDDKSIPYVRFDGQMSAKRRQEVIARFSKPLRDITQHRMQEPESSTRSRKTSKKMIQRDFNDLYVSDASDDDFTMSSSEHLDSDFEDELVSRNKSKGKGKQKQSIRDSTEKSLSYSTSQQNPAVMLISLKAGALGLNLTVANNVYLMDPWWQEGIESQAIDRVNRIGQTKPVHVYRMISENTVESNVVRIQEKKQKLIKEAFSGIKRTETQRQQREARLQDLIELFGTRQQEAAAE